MNGLNKLQLFWKRSNFLKRTLIIDSDSERKSIYPPVVLDFQISVFRRVRSIISEIDVPSGRDDEVVKQLKQVYSDEKNLHSEIEEAATKVPIHKLFLFSQTLGKSSTFVFWMENT